MKLYSFSGSCALGANIVLEWIGQPYELQLLQKNDLASPAIRALNPNGQVPILVDDGWALNENAAILNYLADKFPAAKLGGEPTPRGRAEVNRWLAMINSDVHPAFKPLFGATSYLGDEAMIEKSKDAARQQLRLIETARSAPHATGRHPGDHVDRKRLDERGHRHHQPPQRATGIAVLESSDQFTTRVLVREQRHAEVDTGRRCERRCALELGGAACARRRAGATTERTGPRQQHRSIRTQRV